MKYVALAVATVLAAAAIVRGTFAVGGSDSSCYALMATAFAHGQVQPTFPLAQQVPWPTRADTSNRHHRSYMRKH